MTVFACKNKTYRLLLEHPPRAGLRYELLMDEGYWIGDDPAEYDGLRH